MSGSGAGAPGGGSSEHNPRSALGNNVGIGGYVGGRRRSDESCRRSKTNGEGRGAVAPGKLDVEGTRQGRERPFVGGILRR